jgi:hypothetical protein
MGNAVASRAKRAEAPAVLGRVGERAVEFHDGVVLAAGADPVVDRVAYLLASLGVIAGRIRRALERQNGRAQHPNAVGMCGGDQGPVTADQLGRWLPADRYEVAIADGWNDAGPVGAGKYNVTVSRSSAATVSGTGSESSSRPAGTVVDR